MSNIQKKSNKARLRRNKTRLRVKAMRDRVKNINHPNRQSWYSRATSEERLEIDQQLECFLLVAAGSLAKEGQLDCTPTEAIELIYSNGSDVDTQGPKVSKLLQETDTFCELVTRYPFSD